jgi:RNA polymerase sigma-70 factor (ECF subfamily)
MRQMRLRRGLSLVEIESVYRRSYQGFLRTASAIVGDRHGGEDAVHDGFVAAVRNRGKFREQGSPDAWVWAIVVNGAKARARKRREQLDVSEGAAEFEDADAETPRRALLRAAMEELPERQRLALFLRYYADLDYRTIGQVLGVTPGTVSATLHAAHARLRQDLLEVERC